MYFDGKLFQYQAEHQLEESLSQHVILQQTLQERDLELSNVGTELVEVKENLANLSQELAETNNNLNQKSQEVERATEKISRLNDTVTEMEVGLEQLKSCLVANEEEKLALEAKWKEAQSQLTEVRQNAEQSTEKVYYLIFFFFL